jgi:hypothetical protein
MSLLWQHVHTLPIGKMLKVIDHTKDHLKLASVLLDLNQLTSDAMKLIEADALRFSHGFRALEFDERNKEIAGAIGFRVKAFEIMEESLVSVPSNIDAEIELFSRGKLKSAMFKAHAKAMQKFVPKKHAGVNMKFDSFEALKSAVDGGVLNLKGQQITVGTGEPRTESDARRDAGGAASAGHHTHEGDCGCGGKCGQCGDAKAVMDRESYGSQQEAEARATELGCTSSHATIGPGGKVTWHPCADPHSYSLYASQPVNPAVPAPRANAGSTDKATKPALLKVYVDANSLKGSYYYRMNKLSEVALRYLMSAGIDVGRDDYAHAWAVYDDYGIICLNRSMMSDGPGNDSERYFKCEWSEGKDGEPVWAGVPQEVAVSTSVDIAEVSKAILAMTKAVKVGRQLSQANIERLRHVVDDLAELAAMELSRSATALVERDLNMLQELISAAAPVTDEDPQPKAITDTDAATILLDSKNPELLKHVRRTIDILLDVHQKNAKADQFKKFVRRKAVG